MTRKDFIGQDIDVDDYVAGLTSDNETPSVYQITGFTPKKVRCLDVSDDRPHAATLKFDNCILKLDALAVDELLCKKPKDLLGQDLEIGDFVYGSDGDYIDPYIYEITGFLPRKVQLKKVLGENFGRDCIRLPSDLIKVNPHLVTMGILKAK